MRIPLLIILSLLLYNARAQKDDTALQQLVNYVTAGKYGSIQSIVITKNNSVKLEYYQPGWTGSKPHIIKSITKSITALLIGIAIEQGHIKSVNDLIENYLPAYSPYFKDTIKSSIRIVDILNMQTGIAWMEEPYEQSNIKTLNDSKTDWIKYILSQPMKQPPGKQWDYNSGAAVLLSAIIEYATRIKTEEFAKKYLFDPLSIKNYYWVKSPYDSIVHTGEGLSLAPTDILKIGKLVLQEGKYNGKQVVPAKWIKELYSKIIPIDLGPFKVFYNYLWQVFPLHQNKPDSGDFLVAAGAFGQWICIFPKYNSVVSIFSNNEEDSGAEIIYKHIIPYLQSYSLQPKL